MALKIYQIDAFTSEVFGGNPAAVCPLEEWLPEATMQVIAGENNLAETAFFVPEGDGYAIRWFTPTVEVNLCGHATLASGHVLFEHEGVGGDEIRFQSKSGPLSVRRDGGRLVLDFPASAVAPCATPAWVVEALGREPAEMITSAHNMAVFGSQDEITALRPDFKILAGNDDLGLIVTAPGSDVDFVSRFFAPAWGIDEDPATGSTHCDLTVYWAKRLGKTSLSARQLSARGGELSCSLRGERVDIAGKAVTYLVGSIHLP